MSGGTRIGKSRVLSPKTRADSQSGQTTETGGVHGDDAGKKVNRRKRHAMVDTDSRALVLQSLCREDPEPQRRRAAAMRRAPWLFVELGYADAGCAGRRVAGWLSSRPPPSCSCHAGSL